MPKHRPRKKKTSAHSSSSPDAQRLNKVLAAAGLGSRRKVEELIEQGRVEIDGDVVTDLSCKVEPNVVKIKVDGQLLKKSRPVYYALNKPPGVLSTNYDPSGRLRVIDLVPDRDRVFSVGRLDQSSEGLMLLTNDGELAQRLAHPKFRIQKSYFVVVSGQLTEEELTKLRKGVHLAEGFAKIDGATIKRVRKGCTEIEIILSEGKNREIRRILARAGHKVVLLRRIAIGPLRLGQMPVGAARMLTSSEVKALYAVSEPANRQKNKPTKRVQVAVKSVPKSSAVKSPYEPDQEDVDDLLSLAFGDGDDDDFVGDLNGAGSQGSVIAFDDPQADEAVPTKRTRRSPSSTSQTKRMGTRVSKVKQPAQRSTLAGASSRTSVKKASRSSRPAVRASSSGNSPGRGAPKSTSSARPGGSKSSDRGSSSPARPKKSFSKKRGKR